MSGATDSQRTWHSYRRGTPGRTWKRAGTARAGPSATAAAVVAARTSDSSEKSSVNA